MVDTGVPAHHVDFEGRVAPGYTVIGVGVGVGASDCNCHGTHGIAKAVRVVPVRVLDCAGSGTTSEIVSVLDWVIAQHAAGTPAVANLSPAATRSSRSVDLVGRLPSRAAVARVHD